MCIAVLTGVASVQKGGKQSLKKYFTRLTGLKKTTGITKGRMQLRPGGERGIRTPGPSQVNGFQDRRNRPLCHLSGAKIHEQKHYFK